MFVADAPIHLVRDAFVAKLAHAAQCKQIRQVSADSRIAVSAKPTSAIVITTKVLGATRAKGYLAVIGAARQQVEAD